MGVMSLQVTVRRKHVLSVAWSFFSLMLICFKGVRWDICFFQPLLCLFYFDRCLGNSSTWATRKMITMSFAGDLAMRILWGLATFKGLSRLSHHLWAWWFGSKFQACPAGHLCETGDRGTPCACQGETNERGHFSDTWKTWQKFANPRHAIFPFFWS